MIDRLTNEFSKETPDFRLESIHFTNDFYKSELRSAMEMQRAPDIFHNWGVSSLKPYVRAGRVLDLSPIEDKLKKNFLPIAFGPVTFDGKIYGVPYSGLTGVFFWYRKDLFEKYNLKPPETWREFISVGEKLKENGIIPIALANKNKWPGSFYYMYLVDRIGGPFLFDEVLTGKNNRTFTDPAFIKAGEMIQELVKRDFFPMGFNRMQDKPGTWNSLFITGQAGMYLMGSWFINELSRLTQEEQKQFDIFPFPEVVGGKGSPDDLVGSPGQDYLSISENCRHADAAMRFFGDYINSDQYFRELADQGFVPPVINAEDYLSDPVSKKVARAFNSAGHVQVYYDQILSPTMAEIHKLSVHQLFELRLTPVQTAENHKNAIRSDPDFK